ncbi:hypothetical protein AGMMS49593_08880 [Endomicrobiia bacterium]|nr:hypothetical protein AGMMS49593_08880 [Endomicrobiia bacterium]
MERLERSGDGHNVKSESASNVDPIEREKTIRIEIKGETYGSNILPITYVHGHFWYKSSSDSYAPGDCALYAVVRFLHHAGQLGYIDKDLWDKYTNQELRDTLYDQLNSYNPRSPGDERKEQIEDCRKQGKWLYNLDIYALLYALKVPEEIILQVTPLQSYQL